MLNAPEGLHPAGRAAWRAAVESLHALGEDAESFRTALARYALAVDAEAHVRREWTAGGRPTMSVGSAGQPVCHPTLQELRDWARTTTTLAEVLLLTPKARA